MHFTFVLIICLVGSIHCVPRFQKRAVEESTDPETTQTEESTDPTTIAPVPTPKPTEGTDWVFHPETWVNSIGQTFTASGPEQWIKDAAAGPDQWIKGASSWFKPPSWPLFGNKAE